MPETIKTEAGWRIVLYDINDKLSQRAIINGQSGFMHLMNYHHQRQICRDLLSDCIIAIFGANPSDVMALN